MATSPLGPPLAYAASNASGTVSILDTGTLTISTPAAPLIAPAGVALTPDNVYLYVANSTANTISVIDTVSRTIIATIPVGTTPWGVTVTPDNSHVYVANNGSDRFSYIDTATNTVSSTVAVGHQPTGVGIAASGLTAYVSNNGANTVTILALINMISPPAGPEAGGNIVTVTGTNLAGATAVKFGQVPGTIMANTPNQILVVPPPGVGVALLTVTTPGGTSNPKPYVYAPGSELDSLVPGTGPTAGRNIISIKGNRFSTATQVRFGSVPAVPTVVSDQLITVTVPPAATPGLVPVTVTTAGGITPQPITYTYIDPPFLSAVSPSTGPVPGGNVINLYGLNLSTTSLVTFNDAPVQYSVQSDTVLTVVVPPSPAAGTVDITVTTDSGTSTLTSAYVYV